MKIVILCGGHGTRLAGVGSNLPKPLIPIGGRPIVWHIMKGFSHRGFRDFVLCLGYQSEMFRQYFLNLSCMINDITLDVCDNRTTIEHHTTDGADWRITLAETGYNSMTGARIKRAGKYIGLEDDVFAVTYGDGVTDLDFRRVVAFHREHGRIATVTAVHPTGRFGELSIGSQGIVNSFNEKPQAESGWISGGFFVFSRRFLDMLGDDPGLMLETDPLQRLTASGELMAYRHDGFWFCVDTPRDYEQLSDMWSRGSAPWALWERERV